MSDYEDEFMCDEDEDYDLEYSEDSNSEPDVDLENQYYNSKVNEKCVTISDVKTRDVKENSMNINHVLPLYYHFRH